MACLICGSLKNKTIFKEDGIDIKKCFVCGHVYSSYVQSEFYNGYYPDNIDLIDHYWWKEGHELMYKKFWYRLLNNKSGRLLDVGSGLGYFLKEINEFDKKNCWELFGSETSRSAFDFSRSKLNLRNIFFGPVEKASYEPEYFDFITLWDVFEHLENPRRTLAACYKILKKDACLFIATPNINIQLPKARLKKLFLKNEFGHYLEARDHLHNYSPDTAKRLLTECGFNKVKFIQLPPIQFVSGSKNKNLKYLKNIWFLLAASIFYISGGKINLGNLYLVAYKV